MLGVGYVEFLSHHAFENLMFPPVQLVVVTQSLLPAEGGHHADPAQIELGIEPSGGGDAVTLEGVTEAGNGRF